MQYIFVTIEWLTSGVFCGDVIVALISYVSYLAWPAIWRIQIASNRITDNFGKCCGKFSCSPPFFIVKRLLLQLNKMMCWTLRWFANVFFVVIETSQAWGRPSWVTRWPYHQCHRGGSCSGRTPNSTTAPTPTTSTTRTRRYVLLFDPLNYILAAI